MQKNIDFSPVSNLISLTFLSNFESNPQDDFDEVMILTREIERIIDEISTLCDVIERTLNEMNKPTHAKKN